MENNILQEKKERNSFYEETNLMTILRDFYLGYMASEKGCELEKSLNDFWNLISKLRDDKRISHEEADILTDALVYNQEIILTALSKCKHLKFVFNGDEEYEI